MKASRTFNWKVLGNRTKSSSSTLQREEDEDKQVTHIWGPIHSLTFRQNLANLLLRCVRTTGIIYGLMQKDSHHTPRRSKGFEHPSKLGPPSSWTNKLLIQDVLMCCQNGKKGRSCQWKWFCPLVNGPSRPWGLNSYLAILRNLLVACIMGVIQQQVGPP